MLATQLIRYVSKVYKTLSIEYSRYSRHPARKRDLDGVTWDGTGDGREVDRMDSLTLGYAAAVGALNA